jgi:hypothetical protein
MLTMIGTRLFERWTAGRRFRNCWSGDLSARHRPRKRDRARWLSLWQSWLVMFISEWPRDSPSTRRLDPGAEALVVPIPGTTKHQVLKDALTAPQPGEAGRSNSPPGSTSTWATRRPCFAQTCRVVSVGSFVGTQHGRPQRSAGRRGRPSGPEAWRDSSPMRSVRANE